MFSRGAGRGAKKYRLIFRNALIMASLLIISTVGSVVFKSITLTAFTALLASKFALVLYTVLTLGKTIQEHHNGKPGSGYFDRIMHSDDHNVAAASSATVAYHHRPPGQM